MQFLDYDTKAYNYTLEYGVPAAFCFFGTTGIYAPDDNLPTDLCDGKVEGPDENGISFCQSTERYCEFKQRLTKAVA